MDGTDRELALGQLDHERHDEVVVARRPVARGPPLGLVGEGGLVAVVAVGDHHRRAVDGRA